MGLYVEVIAIGPFSEVASRYIGYSDECYDDSKTGAIVNDVLFGIVEGTSLGKEFASYLGVTDVWDVKQHKIVNDKINVEALNLFASIYTDYAEDVTALIALMKLDFEFHLAPNG